MELGLLRKKKIGSNCDSTFVNQVFSWSVNDILDQNLSKTLGGASVSGKSSEPCCRVGKLFGPFCFINVPEGREEVDDDNVGRRNMVEVAVVMKLVQRLYEEWLCCIRTLHVGVISPYDAQVMEIERRLGKTYGNFSNIDLKVKTVEEFQDGQADVIIVSTVMSDYTEPVELTSDYQKTNFVFSRARHCLWFVGSSNALARAYPLWESVISNAKGRKCFVNAYEDEEMSELITTVKSQLDELEDLLDMRSLIFNGARWKVMFSENFVQSFSKLPSTYSKKVVLKFLLRLANGWRPKKYKADAHYGSSLNIAKQYKVEGRFIICTNDICMESGYRTQVLKLWDILHLVNLPELVNKLEKIYSTFSDHYLSCCKDKCLEGSLEVPRHYNASGYKDFRNADSTNNFYGTSYIENSRVKESLLLMKFYSFSAGVVSHLMSARDGTPINVPFEVTDQEREIILHQQSSFVLGRSGTGKTTVLVMKLFQKEQLHHMASKGFSELNSIAFTSSSSFFGNNTTGTSLRQLFVTVNPKLCIAVKRHISNFQRFIRGETFGEEWITVDLNDMDEYENFKDVPTSFLETPLKVYPLVVTFNIFLLMLDRSIGTSYFSRFPDIRKIFSHEAANFRLVHQDLVRRREVTFEKFRESYWPHFNSKFTKKLDPSRVFTEISTHIKGCLHIGQVGETKLALESYLQFSVSRVSTFGEEERKLIYAIFLDYEKIKMTRGEFDLADLVNDLHRRLKDEEYLGDCMDFVYIDEVQDLTMKQLALLKYICKNVNEGFVFAGDTAQTMARGVDFRFQDIRRLFYEEFLHGVGVVGEDRKQHEFKPSPLFHLSQNFRTHAGILNLAQSISELIYYFFPLSIDKLNPETSPLCGEAPVLLDGGCHGDALSMIFHKDGSKCENLISFGSEQVILVRDDCLKDEVTKCIGGRAIVLTIFECKGLEFQDVLLYNFFGTSTLEDQWRIIFKYMNQNVLCTAHEESVPEFSHSRHNILCYELKQLYVAVTQTKQRLWICEDRNGFSSPIVNYWQKLNVLQVKKLDDTYALDMPVISSSEDWKLQGLKMLEVHNYRTAAQCFEQAGDNGWKTFARASELKEAAQNLRSSRWGKSLEMLTEAADLFESISNKKKAAECYFDAEDYERAGSVYYAESDIQRAGQCFILAECFEKAAEIYAETYLFNECLHACSKGKLFELGLQYIRSWKEDLADLVQEAGVDIVASEQKFFEKCAFVCYRQHDKVAMMHYVKDFSSLKSMQSFLKKLGCLDELLELEVDFGNFVDASKIARQMGNILREADLLEKAYNYQDASLLYLASVFAGSLWADGGRGWPLKEFPSKNELSFKAKASAGKYMPSFHVSVCADIRLMSIEKFSFHELKKLLALSRSHRNLRGEILAARKLLDLMLPDSDVFVKGRRRDIEGESENRFTVRNPKNKVSLTSLFAIWNNWKDKIVKILTYLRSLRGKGPTECTEYGKFCLQYLGVRQRSCDPDSDYFLLYDDANWVRSEPRRSDKKGSLNVPQLVGAGERFWCLELFSVGMKVLEILESARKLGARNHMPMYFNRLILIQIFEAAASLLMHCKFLKQTSIGWYTLMSYIDFSAEDYFLSVFSPDQVLITKDNLNQSEASRNMLKEAIFRRFASLRVYGDVAVLKKPTVPRLIQLVVILLGSSKQIREHHREILSKFDTGSSWQLLLDVFVKGTGQVLVSHFRDALSEMYRSKSEGYHLIPPSCFTYLLDRLLLMVSCSDGCLFATRSSVIEWLVHIDWKINPNTFALAGDAETCTVVTPTYDFLALTVHELLVNMDDTKKWAAKTGFDSGKSYGLLILKLVILLCLIFLNTDNYLELLSDALCEANVIALLPTVFKKVVFERSGSCFRNVIAEALQRIGDPLVVIKNPKMTEVLNVRHAVFLNVFNQSKGSILETLFRPGRQRFH